MPKVVISDSQGLVQSAGTGVQIESSLRFSQLPTATVSAQTAAATLTAPGVYTLSGSTALTWVLPLAANVPGGVFVFRSASAQAHALTGSQETNGTKVFAGMAGATPANQGSKLALEAVQGSSVTLVSDGLSFLVMAASGSCVISGT
jgi:hypothetical protein